MTFEYDSQNRLTKVNDDTYKYDPEGIRISKNMASGKVAYTYDTVSAVSQLIYEERENCIIKYMYANGQLVSQEKVYTKKSDDKQSEGTRVYHYDLRGSTIALTDLAGNITDRYSYGTYGSIQVLEGSKESTQFLYNGRDGVITEENGLYYMRTRYYSPNLRRFINADVLTGIITNSNSMNQYAYVEGNPISMVDPFGLCAENANKPTGKSANNQKWWNKTNSYTKTKAGTTGSSVKNKFSNFKVPSWGHTVLDIGGMLPIPIVGSLCDAVNAGLYLAEGDYVNAGLSALGAIPLAGEISAATKLGTKAGVEATQAVTKTTTNIAKQNTSF